MASSSMHIFSKCHSETIKKNLILLSGDTESESSDINDIGETDNLADHHNETVSMHMPTPKPSTTSSDISNIPEHPNKPANFKFLQQQFGKKDCKTFFQS